MLRSIVSAAILSLLIPLVLLPNLAAASDKKKDPAAEKPPCKTETKQPAKKPACKPDAKKPCEKPKCKTDAERPAKKTPCKPEAKPPAKKPPCKPDAKKTPEKPKCKADAKQPTKKPPCQPDAKPPATKPPCKPKPKKPVETPKENPTVEKPTVEKPTVEKPVDRIEEEPAIAKPHDQPAVVKPAEPPAVVSAPRAVEVPSQQDDEPSSADHSVDADFWFQGEYSGATYTTRLGDEYAGLQVAALGDGQFRGVQYRRGLPGNGWNGIDQILLEGQRVGDSVRLEAHGRLGTYTVVIQNGTAELRNAAWQLLGRLEVVERVSPTMGKEPPPGAIVLFDGSSVNEFDTGEIVEGGLLLAGPVTKREFRDFDLHVEFRTPYMPQARGQGRGNSGCYLQKRYEVQILDSFSLSGEANECGGLYRQRPPDLNMALPPLTWQTYDIDFTAARFDDSGQKTQNARITVVHNGVAVHDNVELPSKTGAGNAEGPTPGPIRFQWHGNPVHFRNLWILEKNAE